MANATPVTATTEAVVTKEETQVITEVEGKAAPKKAPAKPKETSADFSNGIKRETY